MAEHGEQAGRANLPFVGHCTFAPHAVIDPRETRPALREGIGRVRPLVASLAAPRRFGFRPWPRA